MSTQTLSIHFQKQVWHAEKPAKAFAHKWQRAQRNARRQRALLAPRHGHELGNQYISGTLRKKNNLKALAWHRQACRNGYILSYEPCGDIFYNGGFGVKRNKALSLVMYYCAYVNGIREIKEKISRVTKELKEEGEPIPEMAMT